MSSGFPSTSPIFYFKLPYVSHFSVVAQKKICHFIKRYCNDLYIKLVFSSFEIDNLFGVEDPISGGLRHGSRVVWEFACAGCNACYVGKKTRHFSTRVREHLVSDKASHIFKHPRNSLSHLVFRRLFPYFRSRLYEFPPQDKRGIALINWRWHW